MEPAITIWVDESTEIQINGHDFNLVGYLITNSDEEEFNFLNQLKQARKIEPPCWICMHGNEISENDERKFALMDRWITKFNEAQGVYFHAFLYRRNNRYVRGGSTYEHYFAKQSVFSLAHKMKREGYPINTMFRNVSTLNVLFETRRSHSVGQERVDDLETIYKNEISRQIANVTGRNTRTFDFTVRFSFVSSECFDAMQLTDCLLYLMRQKIQAEEGGVENQFTQLFDKHFMSHLKPKDRHLSFRKVYEYGKKINFFQSVA